ncbi:hypothetical protein CRV02_13565 [Arcobacter sp. CECT 8989]|uniref:hypothetical protein n=1 Tax=Arcobacter sp. CECT 8989 TaxID=2044509 RepID=UPI00100C09BC|nr:hypothetical protein [Arcobacter sp. CECT 8989]RXJ98272.1 hypothetical protein CRV02_13565 [Arcobacter sp. CECT 8989]
MNEPIAEVLKTAITIGLPAFITFLATRHTNNNNLKSEVERYKSEIKKEELSKKNILKEKRREYNLKNIEDISIELNKYYKIVESLISTWHDISVRINNKKTYLKQYDNKDVFKSIEKDFLKTNEYLTFSTTKLNMINAVNIIDNLRKLDNFIVATYNDIAINKIPLMKQNELNKFKDKYVQIKNAINKEISAFVNSQFNIN